MLKRMIITFQSTSPKAVTSLIDPLTTRATTPITAPTTLLITRLTTKPIAITKIIKVTVWTSVNNFPSLFDKYYQKRLFKILTPKILSGFETNINYVFHLFRIRRLRLFLPGAAAHYFTVSKPTLLQSPEYEKATLSDRAALVGSYSSSSALKNMGKRRATQHSI